MRYRDTYGDDDWVGTTSRDVFRIRHGIDRVDGAGGRDTLRVDYRGYGFAGSSSDRVMIDATGALSGTIHGGNTSSVSFENIERLKVETSDTRHWLTVQILDNAPFGTVDWQAGGSADALDLYWQTGTAANITTLEDGSLSTGSAVFAGFERIALYLGEQSDVALGGGEADYYHGRGGDDYLEGRGGDDFLYGGGGSDVLIGDEGADTFYYNRLADSRSKAPDLIYTFSHAEGDTINLSRIDANPDLEQNQSFRFIGTDAFTGLDGSDGEVREEVQGFFILLEADVNHDGVADLLIEVHSDVPLGASDLVL